MDSINRQTAGLAFLVGLLGTIFLLTYPGVIDRPWVVGISMWLGLMHAEWVGYLAWWYWVGRHK